MFFSCHSKQIEKQSNKKIKQIILKHKSLRMQGHKNYKKRTFYTPSIIKKRASLTVEAAMVFPIFIFAVLLVIYGMKMIELQSKVQYALDVTAMEMGSYAPSAEKGSENTIGEYISEIVYTKTGAKVLFLNSLNKSEAELKLVSGNKSGFSFSKSEILKDDYEIYLVVNYKIVLPKFLGININIPCVQTAYTRGFTGKTCKNSIEDTIVYITTGQTVYHTNRQCTYLKISVKKIKASKVNKKKYSQCHLCKNKKGTSFVYITSEGERYHKIVSCRSLKRTVQRITLAEVGDRRICKRCSET